MPLSATTLRQEQPNVLSKPKSVWVNPTRPKRSVLSLQRQKRSAYSYNPQIKDLRTFAQKLNSYDFTEKAEFLSILDEIPHPPNRDNALLVLNCLRQWQKTHIFFDWVKSKTVKEEFKLAINVIQVDARRPFCNCLIDICRGKKRHERAHELLYLGTLFGLYPGLHDKTIKEWSLDVRSLSVGAAEIALEEWMRTLSNIVRRQEDLPELFLAQTGTGTHRFSQGLANSFASHLQQLSIPFRQSDRAGIFLASKEELVSWLESKYPP